MKVEQHTLTHTQTIKRDEQTALVLKCRSGNQCSSQHILFFLCRHLYMHACVYAYMLECI